MNCVLMTKDLMQQSQIAQVVKASGMGLSVAGSLEQAVDQASDATVRLVIVDLQDGAGDLRQAANRLRVLAHAPAFLAYGPHVQHGVLDRAREAGWEVFTRGQLHSQLLPLLEKLAALSS